MKKTFLGIFSITVITYLLSGCTTSNNGNITKLSEDKISTRLNKLPSSLTSSDLFNTTVIEPTQLFDNLYFVGYVSVGTFVITTTEGIILIDTMWTPHDAKHVIVPGLKELGLNPEDIKYVIVTHGHSDHYGGAHYFESHYGAKILMRKNEWNYIHNPNAPVLTDPFGNFSTEIPLPSTYTQVIDGEKISLGKTNLTVLATPGHTPGGLSLIIPVTDNGIPHTVALWGGTGLPDTKAANQTYLHSLNYFQKIANKNDVDGSISNHPFSHDLINQINTLKNRKSDQRNPVVTGNKAFNEYIDDVLRNNVQKKLSSFESN
ncbi:MAG: metallo-beta-lactamase class B [Pseudomonadota bacterium]|jgi:metallo-beta-lactamase class B